MQPAWLASFSLTGGEMDWEEERNRLTEQLEMLKRLRQRFGEEVIETASAARLAVHVGWLAQLPQDGPRRPSEAFYHSAFGVTSSDDDLLEFEVITDSETEFSIRVSECRYAQFYGDEGELEIGHALHCALDFGEAKAFSSDVTLKRTKTLMQGDDHCDHCYQRTSPPRL
jgi:hypothetical protein